MRRTLNSRTARLIPSPPTDGITCRWINCPRGPEPPPDRAICRGYPLGLTLPTHGCILLVEMMVNVRISGQSSKASVNEIEARPFRCHGACRMEAKTLAQPQIG